MKKKLLLWSFWPILMLFAFGFYFLLPKSSENTHLKFVPENADFVVLLNPLEFVKSYVVLMEANPAVFDSLELGALKSEDKKPNLDLGFNLMSKIGVFRFFVENSDVPFLGLVVEVNNFNAFVEFLNPSDNKPQPVEYGNGKYLLLEKDAQIILLKDNVGVSIKSEFTKVNDEIAKQCFDEIFTKEKHLQDVDESFAEVLSQKDEIVIWTKKNNKFSESVNPYLTIISNLFDRKITKMNLTPAGFEVDVMLQASNEDAIIFKEQSEKVALQNTECFRVSASLNPKSFDSFFDVILPSEKKYLLTHWTGAISSSIESFKNVSVKRLEKQKNPDQIIPNPNYPFQYEEKDLIDVKIPFAKGGIDEMFSYPYFNFAIELEDVAATKSLIDKDSSISKIGDYYSFVLKDYILVKNKEKQFQRVYFYFVDNALVFTPDLPNSTFQPTFSNFDMVFRFDPFFDNYEHKGMMDGFVIDKVQGLGFNGFELHFVEYKEGYIYLHGVFDLKNTENHLIGFPMLLKKITEYDFLFGLTAI